MEGLYLMAREASFSKVAAPAPEPSKDLGFLLLHDRNFAAMDLAMRLQVLRAVDRAFAKLPLDEQVRTLKIGEPKQLPTFDFK